MAKLFTIGFTGKSAEQFFALLSKAGVRRLLDVRLNNTSQLAGFAKRDDLRFFAERIGGIEYLALRELAPEPAMLTAYRSKTMNWQQYASAYLALLAERSIENSIDFDLLEDGCLLCSEHLPHHCHRRLAAEYVERHMQKPVPIVHLY